MNFRNISAIIVAGLTLISIEAFGSFNLKEDEDSKGSSEVKPAGLGAFKPLPKFVKLEIFKHLDPKSLTKFSETNKYFNSFIKEYSKISFGYTLKKIEKIECEKPEDYFIKFSKAIESSKEYQKAFNEFCSFPNDGYKEYLLTTLPCFQLPPHSDSVKKIAIDGVKLKYLSPAIGKFTNLQKLNLHNNQLRSVPKEICKCANLKYLKLQYNFLTSLPAGIGNLLKLKIFYLHNNQLTSLPAGIGNLPSLRFLNLNDNQLTSLPLEIKNLLSLKFLSVRNNQLTSVPAGIENLTNLESLALWGNPIESLKEEIEKLKEILKRL